MDVNLNRLIVGLILITIVVFSYFLRLDQFLIYLTFILVLYEIKKLNLISKYLFFIFIFLVLNLLLLFINTYHINYLLVFVGSLIIFLTTISKNLKIYLFLFSIFIFFSMLISSVIIDRNIIYIIIFSSFFNDTIAYIVGRTFGGPLIIPSISPKKTWSGTTFSFIATSILLVNLNFNILLSFIMSLSLFFGDIFFSYIKRNIGIKDFSNLLGSHGGILDRLDSMFFLTMIFYVYLII